MRPNLPMLFWTSGNSLQHHHKFSRFFFIPDAFCGPIITLAGIHICIRINFHWICFSQLSHPIMLLFGQYRA